jgi:TetR/AcrR family transcriptional regulator, repressor for neighboring sulfatase
MTSSRPTTPRRRPGPRPRRGAPAGPDEVRRAVLDTAADLFARQRVDNVSLRQIAEAANVQLSLISRYIGSREDLIAAVLDDLSRAVAADVLARPTEQISFERDSAMGRWTRVLAHRALAGEDVASKVEFNPVRAIAEVAEREYGLDPFAARLRGAQVVASALGWRLFEDFLVQAAGLDHEPLEAMRQELTGLHRRMAATPYPSPPDPRRRARAAQGSSPADTSERTSRRAG